MSTSKHLLVVAVVEDDAPVRRAIGRLLASAGFEPALFESAESYIDASPAPLCIIVDVWLPGMSGLELLQRLGATAPPIIMITSDHNVTIRDRALQNGCAAFFWKPVDGNVLISTIASLANRVANEEITPSRQ